MMCLDKSIPNEIWELLPKDIQVHYVERDKQYMLCYGVEGKVSLSVDDILNMEKKCRNAGIDAQRFGSLHYRVRLHVSLDNETWKFVSQSLCRSLDTNSNPRMYGYLKRV